MVAGAEPEIVAYFAKPSPRGQPPAGLAAISSGGRIVDGLAIGLVALLVGFVALEDPSFMVPTAIAAGLLLGLPIALVGRRIRRRDARLVREGRLVEAELLAREPRMLASRGKSIPGQALVFGVDHGARRFPMLVDDAWLARHAPELVVGARVPMIVHDGERLAVLLLAGQVRLVYAA